MYCKKCGQQLEDSCHICGNCGTRQSQKLNIKKIGKTIGILFVFGLVVGVIFQYEKIQSLTHIVENLQSQTMDNNAQESNMLQEKAWFLDNKIGLYTETTRTYHTYSCPIFRAESSYVIDSIENLNNDKKLPCPQCRYTKLDSEDIDTILNEGEVPPSTGTPRPIE